MKDSFAELRRKSGLMNKKKLADRFGPRSGSIAGAQRHKLADGGVISAGAPAPAPYKPILPPTPVPLKVMTFKKGGRTRRSKS